ncbi:hypothetical protein LR48_Vigan205s009300 [Vigna angularis]|uniref:Uncharacterized protein n=1 Tax=Phaseolus angularis TaxID=3914 RepID=A0A0L9T6L0_PHAAN|nr:hypothetical protein LR48_Vigan205s009300 [Vigna angularis]
MLRDKRRNKDEKKRDEKEREKKKRDKKEREEEERKEKERQERERRKEEKKREEEKTKEAKSKDKELLLMMATPTLTITMEPKREGMSARPNSDRSSFLTVAVAARPNSDRSFLPTVAVAVRPSPLLLRPFAQRRLLERSVFHTLRTFGNSHVQPFGHPQAFTIRPMSARPNSDRSSFLTVAVAARPNSDRSFLPTVAVAVRPSPLLLRPFAQRRLLERSVFHTLRTFGNSHVQPFGHPQAFTIRPVRSSLERSVSFERSVSMTFVFSVRSNGAYFCPAFGSVLMRSSRSLLPFLPFVPRSILLPFVLITLAARSGLCFLRSSSAAEDARSAVTKTLVPLAEWDARPELGRSSSSLGLLTARPDPHFYPSAGRPTHLPF